MNASAATSNALPIRPLQGITVLALEHAVAAPFASRQLADLGARVIKIERPGVGDFARGYDSTVMGQSSFFVWCNRGKESLALDLKDPVNLPILHKLLSQCDVLIQNLAPGATARMGLDFDSLHAQYPRLIVCDVSGYGEGGPYSNQKAYDLLIQAASGLISVTGTPELPARTGISIADISAGMYAYSGILSALLQRSHSGQGMQVDVTMLESLTEWMSYPLNFSHYGGKPPVRSGLTHPTIAPYGQYRAGDGKSVIFGLQNDREWADFCRTVLQQPHLAEDPRFSKNMLRVQNRAELDALIQNCFAPLSREQVLQRLNAGGIANAPLNEPDDVWAHPQLQARERWREVTTPAGPIQALLPPATLSGVEAVMGAVPALGEHTQAILQELGF
ncbi:MAG: CaiB/BaiF CoA-transferase family protein [Comamonas sp.]